jgi:hypothetical protein
MLGEILGSSDKADKLIGQLESVTKAFVFKGDNTYNPDWNHPSATVDWRMLIGPYARANWQSFPSEVREGLRKDSEEHIAKMTQYLALATLKKAEYKAATGQAPQDQPTTAGQTEFL